MHSTTKVALFFTLLILSELTQAHEATFYVVRHAEKQQGKDPLLTAAGMQRAERIAGLLASRNLRGVYTTNYKRTISTAIPAAAKAGLELIVYDPAKPENLVQTLKTKSGSYLVVGHSNTAPDIAARLSGQEVAPINHDEYGRVYVITINPSDTTLAIQSSDE